MTSRPAHKLDELQLLLAKQRTWSKLERGGSILSPHKFDKKAVTQTLQGKKLASIYLAQHIDELQLKGHVVLDVGSELELLQWA